MTTEEPSVRMKSLPCPGCEETITILLTHDEYDRWLGDGELIQHVLGRFDKDIRERFISGYCDPCWQKLFGEEEDD